MMRHHCTRPSAPPTTPSTSSIHSTHVDGQPLKQPAGGCTATPGKMPTTLRQSEGQLFRQQPLQPDSRADGGDVESSEKKQALLLSRQQIGSSTHSLTHSISLSLSHHQCFLLLHCPPDLHPAAGAACIARSRTTNPARGSCWRCRTLLGTNRTAGIGIKLAGKELYSSKTLNVTCSSRLYALLNLVLSGASK